MSDMTPSDVLIFDQDRIAAMIAGDVSRLETLLDERLVYTHSSAAVDDKAGFLDKIASGVIDYTSIQPRDVKVTMTGATALVFSDMAIDLRLNGTQRSLSIRTLSVWCQSGPLWRLLAFHSTPIPG